MRSSTYQCLPVVHFFAVVRDSRSVAILLVMRRVLQLQFVRLLLSDSQNVCSANLQGKKAEAGKAEAGKKGAEAAKGADKPKKVIRGYNHTQLILCALVQGK
jgi:hypothetical protein